MRGKPYWIAGGIGLATALLVVARAELGPSPVVTRIADVKLAPATGTAPPPQQSTAWRSANLPRDWRPRGDGRDVWCRAELFLDRVPVEPLQLLISQVAFGADIRVNGQLLSVVGRGGSGWWGRREIVWLAIPPRDLRAGSNEISMRLHVRPEFAGYLTPLFVGPADELQGAYRARNAVISGPDVLALVAATLAMVYFAVYRRIRRPEWAWLGIGIGALAIGGLPFRAVDYLVWSLAMGVAITCVVCAMHRGGGLRRRRVERAAFALLALLAAASLLAPPSARLTLALSAAAFDFAAVVYQLSLYAKESVAGWLAGTIALRAAVALALLWSMNDVPLLWDRAPILGIPLFPVAHLPILVASFVHIVGFLGDGLARVTALNLSLQQSQARLLALERAQATRTERERMQRDLHDGLGAQLVSALAVAEREPHDSAAVQRSLRGALGELRGAVDSLDGEALPLSEVLGTLRSRIEPLLSGTGTELRWRVANLEAPLSLAPQQGVHLLRIVQEAIANTVKHASARTVEVACGEAERGGRRAAYVEVRDDGCGIEPGAVGRGLSNMRSRADQLGGEIELESSGAGTRVVLWLAPGPTPSA